MLESSGVKYLFHDVICKYWPWMKNVCIVPNQSAEESTLIPAWGQMHGKVHKWTCRVSLAQNNDWFLATLNISCVSVHCNRSSCKYWLKKNKRAGFDSTIFARQVWFLTQVWIHSGRSFISLHTFYVDHLYNYVYTLSRSITMCFNVYNWCVHWGCVIFKISRYRIELPNIITKFTRKRSHSCLRHDLSNAVISVSLLYYRVLYGSQWQDGAGHTTWEEMETAFQYLSRCGSTTKNMTRAGLYNTWYLVIETTVCFQLLVTNSNCNPRSHRQTIYCASLFPSI